MSPNPVDVQVNSAIIEDLETQINELLLENQRLKIELSNANYWRERHCTDAENAAKQSAANWHALTLAGKEMIALKEKIYALENECKDLMNINAELLGHKQPARQPTDVGLSLEVPYCAPQEVDVDGWIDGKGVRYLGKALRQENGKYVCLADVNGCLCRVECAITFMME